MCSTSITYPRKQIPKVGVDQSGLLFGRFGGIPGFWDGYCEMSKKDLERECRVSKKVDWMMNDNYDILEMHFDHTQISYNY